MSFDKHTFFLLSSRLFCLTTQTQQLWNRFRRASFENKIQIIRFGRLLRLTSPTKLMYSSLDEATRLSIPEIGPYIKKKLAFKMPSSRSGSCSSRWICSINPSAQNCFTSYKWIVMDGRLQIRRWKFNPSSMFQNTSVWLGHRNWNQQEIWMVPYWRYLSSTLKLPVIAITYMLAQSDYNKRQPL